MNRLTRWLKALMTDQHIAQDNAKCAAELERERAAQFEERYQTTLASLSDADWPGCDAAE